MFFFKFYKYKDISQMTCYTDAVTLPCPFFFETLPEGHWSIFGRQLELALHADRRTDVR